MKYLERSVGDKKIIWFGESNRYSLVEIPAYEVVQRLGNGDDPKKIARWCTRFYHLPKAESNRFVDEVQQLVEQQSILNGSEPGKFTPIPSGEVPSRFYSVKLYSLNDCLYSVQYETEPLEYLIHPKFAHLEIDVTNNCDDHFQVFRHEDRFVLRVNGNTIGQWLPEEANYLTGRFSMELLIRMYKKPDPGWMAVFHASAISKGTRCMMFLGDSGSGKSTLAAILMSCGFDLLADDFVPVDVDSGEVFYFPAAVSVKKNAFDHLIPLYPQLEAAAEFYYPGMDKTVRYLAQSDRYENSVFSYPCQALVFIKYQQDSGMILEKMPKDTAFQHLVPDSWISPLPESASRFLDWFLEMPCYRLTYSDNAKMVEAIEELFKHDL